MCTSAPATAWPFESLTSPCSVEGPTGAPHAAVAKMINPAKPIRRELVNIDAQRDGVCPILQRWIAVMAITLCMNLSNFVRVAALDANLCTLDRLAAGIFHKTVEPG